MSFAVVAAAGGAIVGGVIASNGAKSAAKTQAQAEQSAQDTNKQIFDQQVALQEPFRQTGLSANNRLAFLLGLPGGQGGAPAPGVPQGGSPLLTPGSDGVFAPHAEIPQASARAPAPIPAGPAGTALSQLGLSDRFSVGPDGNSFVSNSTGQALPLSYFTSGQYENDARDHGGVYGPNGAYQNSVTSAQPGMPAVPANNFADAGALNQQFGASDFAADGAPKVPAFGQTIQPTPTFDQYGGAQDLTGFQDMPDFNPDMLKDDPGYAFRLNEGMKGVNNSAAAKGGALSGAAIKAADRYTQDYASGEYGNAFNRYQTTRGNKLQDFLTNRDTTQLNNTNALQTYGTNLNTQNLNHTNSVNDEKDAFAQYQANRANTMGDYQGAFDRFQTSRGNVINPLLSLMGYGQQAVNGTSSAAQNFGGVTAAAITGAGNARAAGQVGSASAINGAIGQGTNNLMSLLQRPGGFSGQQASLSNTPLGSSGFGTGLAYGNQDFGQFF